jgi:hypothetical protein
VPSVQLDATPPVIRSLEMHPKRFRRRHRATVFYLLSEPATVTFSIERCTTVRRRTRCKRLAIRFAQRDGVSGPQRFVFKRTLRPGTYKLDAVAKDLAGNVGRQVKAAFGVK